MCGLIRSLDANDMGAEGAKHLAEGLAKNRVLVTLEYAPPHPEPRPQAL